MTFIRSYQLKCDANSSKLKAVNDLLPHYQKLCCQIASHQWKLFFTGNKFDKNKKINCKTKLSARYIQTANFQVVGQLNSYISNVQNRFKEYIQQSSISDENLLKEIYTINKAKKWLDKSYLGTAKREEDLSDEARLIAKKLFKHLIKNKSNFKNVNLNLDAKVAAISLNDANKTSHFDYWIKLSTLNKGCPVEIPLTTNNYFEDVDGLLKNFVQINKDKTTGELSFRLFKEITPKLAELTATKLGIDVGIVNLMVTNYGDIYGVNYLKYLEKKKAQRMLLFKRLTAQGIKPTTNKRFVKYGKEIKSYIKNEVRRLVNKMIALHNPCEIVVEKLNFSSSRLGRKTNSRLHIFGKKQLKDKLESVSAERGIKLIEVNPAYTSQACNRCSHVSKANRKGQKFKCLACGFVANADVNAAKNIRLRSSYTLSVKKEKIRCELLKKHNEWQGSRVFAQSG